MIVALLPDAEIELEDIADYIARENPSRALSSVREIREKCLSLATMPYAFPLVPRYEERGVRCRGHGRYLIFYRVIDAPAERIDILHVLHTARDYAEILFPD
jgi:toxin ParE1/3/4